MRTKLVAGVAGVKCVMSARGVGKYTRSYSVALAQVRGLKLGCKLRFGHRGLGGGLPAAGAKILAILSVNQCI